MRTVELSNEGFELSDLSGPGVFVVEAAEDAIRGGGETDENAVSECEFTGVGAVTRLCSKEGGTGGTGGGGSGVIVGKGGDVADRGLLRRNEGGVGGIGGTGNPFGIRTSKGGSDTWWRGAGAAGGG